MMAVLDDRNHDPGDVPDPRLHPRGKAAESYSTARRRLRVGAVEHEHVRELRDGQPLESAGASVQVPSILDVYTVAAAEIDGPEPLRDFESDGGQNEIDLADGAVGGDDAGVGELHDAVRHQFDVVAGQGPVPLVVHDRTTCCRRVVGDEALDEIRSIVDLSSDVLGQVRPEFVVALAELTSGGAPFGIGRDCAAGVGGLEGGGAGPVPVVRNIVEHPPHFLGHRFAVAFAWCDPLRSSLEHIDLVGALGDPGQ